MIEQILRNPKDQRSPLSSTGVYKIFCTSGQIYIGETGRELIPECEAIDLEVTKCAFNHLNIISRTTPSPPIYVPLPPLPHRMEKRLTYNFFLLLHFHQQLSHNNPIFQCQELRYSYNLAKLHKFRKLPRLHQQYVEMSRRYLLPLPHPLRDRLLNYKYYKYQLKMYLKSKIVSPLFKSRSTCNLMGLPLSSCDLSFEITNVV
ncbi:hypothetical protein ALC53_10986 [Atta colombica]|uniref:Uncharacterized protein n=1 Tax=Atta colombica TaxID=520822 RepID=A0A195B1I9_9HYME|nr:hypothetical protein ALC53_10986 [Atta colombica]